MLKEGLHERFKAATDHELRYRLPKQGCPSALFMSPGSRFLLEVIMFSRVFTSLFDGSMRGQSDLILVFVNILCHKDKEGFDDRHWKAISDETGLSIERVRNALLALESPDQESRSRNNDGRRIQRIDPDRDWGWQVINAKKYDAIRTTEERRAYMRDLMREHRAKHQPDIPTTLAPPLVTSDIGSLVERILSCRPEFSKLNRMAVENTLKDVPIKPAKLAVTDFCRDMENALSAPNTPLKLLSSYLYMAINGKQKPAADAQSNTIANMEKEIERSKKIQQEALK